MIEGRLNDEGCASVRGLEEPEDIAISPNGRSAYMVGFDSNSIAIFDRDPHTGALAQKAGKAGCISEGGEDGCQDTDSILIPTGVEISPDGRNVYVVSRGEDEHETPDPEVVPTARSISIFDRDPRTGSLTQKPGRDGCISGTGNGGDCTFDGSLATPYGIAISPNGRGVFVSYANPDGVSAFRRDPSTGSLTQVGGRGGCVVEGGDGGACLKGGPAPNPRGLAVSPNGRSLYLASPGTGVSSFAVGRGGTLRPVFRPVCPVGCPGRGVGGAKDLVVSPAGERVYVAAPGLDGVLVFHRASSGRLTLLRGTGGCVSEHPARLRCQRARGLSMATGVALSPGGGDLYVVGTGSNLAALSLR